jgi:hypothetical protein
MDSEWFSLVQKLATMNVTKNPEINIIDPLKLEQYPVLITAIDTVLRNKLSTKTLMLPELRENGNETIAIYSDYSGENSISKYYTYSILVCGYNHSFGLGEQVNKIRQKYALGEKEIAYKELGYGPMKRSLNEYLLTLDNFVVGLLFSIVIDKKIDSFFVDKKKNLIDILENEALGSWDQNSAEKLLRIVHIISYFIALLSKDGQKIFWMTDEDAIAPNKEKHQQTLIILQRTLPIYTKNRFKIIRGAIPFKNEGLNYLDFLSSTDIAAGAINAYFNNVDEKGNGSVKEGAENILKWLCHNGIGLKKIQMLIDKDQDGISSSEIVFNDNNQDPNAVKVSIPI